MSDFVHGDSAVAEHAHEHAKQHAHDLDLDVEKKAGSSDIKSPIGISSEPEHDVQIGSAEYIRARELQQSLPILRKLRRGEEWLDEIMGIETQGIDRIKEEDKKPPSILNVFLLWWSMTLHVGTLPIGILGPEFGLSLGQSCAAIVVGTFLGAACTAYCGTLGPKV